MSGAIRRGDALAVAQAPALYAKRLDSFLAARPVVRRGPWTWTKRAELIRKRVPRCTWGHGTGVLTPEF